MSRTISINITCDECGEATLESDVLVVPFKYGKTERLLDICRPCDGYIRDEALAPWLNARPSTDKSVHECMHSGCDRTFNTLGAMNIHITRIHGKKEQ